MRRCRRQFSALATADAWGINYTPRTHEYAKYDEFGAALIEKNATRAWSLAQKFTTPPPRHMCTSFLQILPSGHFTAHFWAPKAFQFFELMQSYQISANSLEYALLINLAAKSRQQSKAMRLWEQASIDGVTNDANLWNQYISAACDGDPELWPWRSRDRLSLGLEPERVLHLMTSSNVKPNLTTLQILMASIARRGEHRLPDLGQILQAILSMEFRPQLKTYKTLVQCYAFYNQFIEGFKLALSQFTKPELLSLLRQKEAAKFWNECIRLCIDNNVPKHEFDFVWTQLHVYNFKPDLGTLTMRVEYLENKNLFEDIYDMLPALRTSPDHLKLAGSALQRLVTGIANTSDPLNALKKLIAGNKMGIYTNKDMYLFLEEKGATKEQLRLFEEDDDEDHIF